MLSAPAGLGGAPCPGDNHGRPGGCRQPGCLAGILFGFDCKVCLCECRMHYAGNANGQQQPPGPISRPASLRVQRRGE